MPYQVFYNGADSSVEWLPTIDEGEGIGEPHLDYFDAREELAAFLRSVRDAYADACAAALKRRKGKCDTASNKPKGAP